MSRYIFELNFFLKLIIIINFSLKVGDVQESMAIYDAYRKGSKNPLNIGLLKSNIGHGEGASGVAAVTKVIISYENKCIPANLNLKKLKSSIAAMSPPLLPVNDNLPYSPGIQLHGLSTNNNLITILLYMH